MFSAQKYLGLPFVKKFFTDAFRRYRSKKLKNHRHLKQNHSKGTQKLVMKWYIIYEVMEADLYCGVAVM